MKNYLVIIIFYYFISGCSLISNVHEDYSMDTAKNNAEILSCNSGVINDFYFELGGVYSKLRTFQNIDSFLSYYNVSVDTISEIRHSTHDTFWIARRKYFSQGLDSSYFIFQAVLFRNNDNLLHENSDDYIIYTLYDANICDEKLQFSNGVYIGMSRDLFSNQLKLSMDTTQDIFRNFIACDTFQVNCDGLCGHFKYIFISDTLSAIVFKGLEYEF